MLARSDASCYSLSGFGVSFPLLFLLDAICLQGQFALLTSRCIGDPLCVWVLNYSRMQYPGRLSLFNLLFLFCMWSGKIMPYRLCALSFL